MQQGTHVLSLHRKQFLSGFTWTRNPGRPSPLYVVYGMQFANLAFAPAIVTMNQSRLISQDVDYFKRLLEYQSSKAFCSKSHI